jgi:hypothetical protein
VYNGCIASTKKLKRANSPTLPLPQSIDKITWLSGYYHHKVSSYSLSSLHFIAKKGYTYYCVASSLNIISALFKVVLHGIQLLNYILQLLAAYLISNPCAIITLFKWTIFTSTFDFLTQRFLNFLLQPKLNEAVSYHEWFVACILR